MLMSNRAYGRMQAAATKEVGTSWLVQDPAKQSWLGLSVAGATRHACNSNNQAYAGASDSASDARRQMYRDIKRDGMKENELCGFIFLPIILAAVLSWLSKRILDRWFNGDFND